MKNIPVWTDSAPPPQHAPLRADIDVDVAIAGAGITGLTAACLLQAAGRTVAVIDQHDVASGETSHTTAHATYVTDSRLHELSGQLGDDGAWAFWDAGRLAMEQIKNLTDHFSIDCGLREVPGFLFAAADKDTKTEVAGLQRDADLAVAHGFDADFITADPLYGRPAVRFANQLKFHPLRYVNALAEAFKTAGGQIYGHTRAQDVDAGQQLLHTPQGRIRYDALITATHVPLQGERSPWQAAFFQTKLAAYSSYVLEARIEARPEALYWDTNDPYLYLRIDETSDGHRVIIGGEDHKTGQEDDPGRRYAALHKILLQTFPSAEPLRRWSGQVLETPDGLPYIGEVSLRQFIATGFSGNGTTLGTFGAMLIRDLVLGISNPWSELFDPARKRGVGGWEYLRENKDFPLHFVKDRLAPPQERSAIPNGSGAVVKVKGKKCAVYRNDAGADTLLSPVCPHMGCIVSWNDAEKSWDCPCHGSRFSATGDLLAGPAETGLEAFDSKEC